MGEAGGTKDALEYVDAAALFGADAADDLASAIEQATTTSSSFHAMVRLAILDSLMESEG